MHSTSASLTLLLSASEPSALAPAFEEDILRARKCAPAVDPR
jgi:hypothetical protein